MSLPVQLFLGSTLCLEIHLRCRTQLWFVCFHTCKYSIISMYYDLCVHSTVDGYFVFLVLDYEQLLLQAFLNTTCDTLGPTVLSSEHTGIKLPHHHVYVHSAPSSDSFSKQLHRDLYTLQQCSSISIAPQPYECFSFLPLEGYVYLILKFFDN